MPLSAADVEMLKRLYQRLDPLEAIAPGDDRYEPLYQSEDTEDPVNRLKTQIEWNGEQSLHLFSGFRGSGKTTELFRLRGDLQRSGAVVIYANAFDYLNPAEPVEISDLLLVLAGAISDRLTGELDIDLHHETFWQRITGYLKRVSLSVTEAAVKVETDSPAKELLGGLNAGLEVKLALKEESSFRQRLRQFLQNRLPELKAEVNAFVEQGVKAVRAVRGEDTRIVFLFDQLEQLQGSTSTEQSVISSVERLFASHLDKLRLPYIHAVYTVPPWLQFVLPGGAEVELLPSLQLWRKDAARSRNPKRWDAVRSLVHRRFGAEGFARIFGAAPEARHHELADRMIEASGGYFRDLFRMLRELLVRLQTQAKSLPATAPLVEGAIQRVREQYLPLAVEDAERLAQIDTSRKFVLPRASADEAARASRLLNLHLVFYFSNGEEWYDVHPLIREEVPAVLGRKPEKPARP